MVRLKMIKIVAQELGLGSDMLKVWLESEKDISDWRFSNAIITILQNYQYSPPTFNRMAKFVFQFFISQVIMILLHTDLQVSTGLWTIQYTRNSNVLDLCEA